MQGTSTDLPPAMTVLPGRAHAERGRSRLMEQDAGDLSPAVCFVPTAEWPSFDRGLVLRLFLGHMHVPFCITF